MAKIDKEILKHLAELARIEIEEKDEEKLLKDLQEIIDYFKELKGVNIENVESMTGGSIFLSNIFRDDDLMQINADDTQINADTHRRINVDKKDKKISENLRKNQRRSALVESFPEEEDGFLKIPPVFK
ncbi:MAG TPA: Asp-tRNA(Asn)/Glu-tRNA(Gln) amidotransferase subunit GatC [Candidatus Wolfebacteria bacterium]|nr:Asp-tRNA(Asn)/Glu-tRNA(Gln) amidotransferase subunit GatC [Candidatus Wolfebacteria bacterium]